ncbi:ATP-binding protein [Paracraurococcus lichenis]|uniref:ATP-binding protein n=1 Tax=Paracraurococcus lichenis TaxID=3064888 RepID=UPI00351CE769
MGGASPRHSGAHTVAVRLRVMPGHFAELCLEDDGRGFSDACAPADDPRAVGVGIPGMRARVRQLGGTLRIESGHGGTVVQATVPLHTSDHWPGGNQERARDDVRRTRVLAAASRDVARRVREDSARLRAASAELQERTAANCRNLIVRQATGLPRTERDAAAPVQGATKP